MPLVEQELLSLPEQRISPLPGFYWVSCYSILSFMCMFCRSLFVLLSFFFWPLCCLFFFDLRILITPLVSSNSSLKLISSICLSFWFTTCYVWWMCFLTDSRHSDEYQLCFCSRWLVPLFVWGRLHSRASHGKLKEASPILLFHCLLYRLCPLNK